MPPTNDDDDLDLDQDTGSTPDPDEERLTRVTDLVRALGSRAWADAVLAATTEERDALFEKAKQLDERAEYIETYLVSTAGLQETDVTLLREAQQPELADQIDQVRQEAADRHAREAGRERERQELASLEDAEREKRLAAAQEEADYENRVHAVNQVIEAANQEGTPAIRPTTNEPVVVHGDRVPEALKATYDTFHRWVGAPGHERTKIWNGLSQLEQDLLSTVYGVRGPVDPDELSSLKEE
jgi:hypothetical protein